MKYFKYKNISKTEYVAYKEQYAALNDEEKKLFRKQKILEKLGTVIFFFLAVLFSVGGISLINLIPEPDTLLLSILLDIGKIILWLVAVILSSIPAALVATPFWAKATTNRAAAKKDALSKAVAHLREYYGLQEPCLVTKCYDCDDEKFINHDVCIFVADNQLRITTNLKHGFFYGENDLGCYVFDKNELTISEVQTNHYVATELKAKNFRFLLGKRAGSFIRKNFLF